MSLLGFSQYDMTVDILHLDRGGELYYLNIDEDTLFINSDTLMTGNSAFVSVDATNISSVAYTTAAGDVIYESFAHTHPEYGLQTSIDAIYDSLAVHLDTLQSHNARIIANTKAIDSLQDTIAWFSGNVVYKTRTLTLDVKETGGVHEPITIDGAQSPVTYDLSSDRSWDIGHKSYTASPNDDGTLATGDTIITKLGEDGYGHVNSYHYGILPTFSEVKITNQSNDRLITCTGTTDSLVANFNLTYNDTTLSILGSTSPALTISNTQIPVTTNLNIGEIVFEWHADSSQIANINVWSDNSDARKGLLYFGTTSDDDMMIDGDGEVLISPNNLSHTSDAKSTLDIQGSISYLKGTDFITDNTMVLMSANQTLPTLASSIGRFFYINIASTGYTLTGDGTEKIVYNNAVAANSVSLPIGFYICYNATTEWLVVGIKSY